MSRRGNPYAGNGSSRRVAAAPRRYRWLELDVEVRSVARVGSAHGWLRGEQGRVEVLPPPGVVGNVLVRFHGFGRVVVPAGTVRPVPTLVPGGRP